MQNGSEPDQYAPLLRALDEQPRRQVTHAHCRLNLVHVLATFAAGARKDDFDVLLGQHGGSGGAFGQHRHHFHARETRLPRRLRVERRQPHQAVGTLLSQEEAVRVPTSDLEHRRLDACLIPLREL